MVNSLIYLVKYNSTRYLLNQVSYVGFTNDSSITKLKILLEKIIMVDKSLLYRSSIELLLNLKSQKN